MTQKIPHDPSKITGTAMKKLRIKLGTNQTDFWSVIGVTQSAGSRYESGREIPSPAAIAAVFVYADEISTHKRSIFQK